MTPRKIAYLEVVEFATGNVVKTVEVTNPDSSCRGDTKIGTVEMGMLRNMNLEEYGVREKGKS